MTTKREFLPQGGTRLKSRSQLNFNAGRIAIQGLLAASLLGGAYTTADAQSVIATPVRSKAAATLQGVVSVRELAASQANLEALQGQQRAPPVEQPYTPCRTAA